MFFEQTDDEWFAVTEEPLSVGALYDWAVRPDCGAVVVFSGTVRDHAREGDDVRTDVTHLEYEAYEEEVVPRLRAIAAETRARWSDLGRIAMVHRVGRLALTESSVLVVVSAPHRPEAFAAARFAIDALKASAPIWKKEEWSGGSAWGTGATRLTEPNDVPAADEASVR